MMSSKKLVHSERVKLKHSSCRLRLNNHDGRWHNHPPERNLGETLVVKDCRKLCCWVKTNAKCLRNDIEDVAQDYRDKKFKHQSQKSIYNEINQKLFYKRQQKASKVGISPTESYLNEQKTTRRHLHEEVHGHSRRRRRKPLRLNLYSSNGCSNSTSYNCNISRTSLYSIVRFLIICHVIQTLPLFVDREASRWILETNCQSADINLLLASSDNDHISNLVPFQHQTNSDLQRDVQGNENSFDNLVIEEDIASKYDGKHNQQPDIKLTEEHKQKPLDFIKQFYHQHHHHYHQHQRNSHHKSHVQKDRIRRHHGGFYDNSAADRPLVATRKGLVRGVTQKVPTGKFVDAFLGIPYAQAPTGKYRFRHPQPTKPWTDELDASQMPNSCYQVNDTFFGPNFLGTSIWNANTPLHEDCLYLNVWTPFGTANTTVPASMNNNPTHSMNQRIYRPPDRDAKPVAKRPVLVWIFGGGFYSGTSSLALYEGGVLASEEDIIVVSMNYRVSALGFLYFGRPDSPGNAGLFDQLMALQWVNDNIDQFGGDPNRVTIFGESAGAVSVAFHLLSPLSRNLFSQAILQSGAATSPWGFKETTEIVANGLQLASLLNCPSNTSDLDGVVECLLKADPMALVSQRVGQTKTILNFPFVPVVDGSFLLEPPVESLIKSNFKRARILLGSNYDEGNYWLIYLPEFSQCPSSGNNGMSTETRSSQVSPPDFQSNSNGDLSGDSGNSPIVAELRNPTHQSIESLELLTTGRQYASTRQNAESEAQYNMNNSYDSKPCKPNEFPSLTRDDFLRVLKENLNPYAEHPIGKEAIVFEYSNWNNPQDSVSNYDALDKIVGDYHFTCHVNELAQRYALAGNSVFMYYFKQRSSMSPWPKWMGVLHADEINFIFGEPLNQMFNYTAKEIELSRRMMKYWANFAKYG